MNQKHSILLFQRIIPAYRIPVFRKLYTRLGVITCYSDGKKNHSLQSADGDMDYPSEKLKRVFIGESPTRMLQNVCKPLSKYKPEIVICEGSPSYLTLWALKLLKPWYGYKMIIWTHGIKNNEVEKPFSSSGSKLALQLMNHADAVIVYSKGRKEILEKYINEPAKLFLASNTLDTSLYESILKNLVINGKNSIKQELGWTARFNLIFIGRILVSKGVRLLIEAFEILPDDLDVHLHIVGEGPLKTRLKQESEADKRIHWYGAVYNEEMTAKFLYASDIMLMPGYLGLSVIHAFAFGCPVITCKTDPVNGPFHSPEFEYIKDGYNGHVVEQSASALETKILDMINDETKRKSLSEEAFKTAYEIASVDQMLKGFENAIKYANN